MVARWTFATRRTDSVSTPIGKFRFLSVGRGMRPHCITMKICHMEIEKRVGKSLFGNANFKTAATVEKTPNMDEEIT